MKSFVLLMFTLPMTKINKNEINFYNELTSKLRPYANEGEAGGDFNCPLENIDKIGGKDISSKKNVIQCITEMSDSYGKNLYHQDPCYLQACLQYFRSYNATEVYDICFKFIWNLKPDKVKRNTLVGPLEKGGLNMVDFTMMDKS